jgi:hypothetical protein
VGVLILQIRLNYDLRRDKVASRSRQPWTGAKRKRSSSKLRLIDVAAWEIRMMGLVHFVLPDFSIVGFTVGVLIGMTGRRRRLAHDAVTHLAFWRQGAAIALALVGSVSLAAAAQVNLTPAQKQSICQSVAGAPNNGAPLMISKSRMWRPSATSGQAIPARTPNSHAIT